MALTAKGTPYVVSTDLVANYPTVSSDLADHIDDNLAYNAVTINAQTGSGANAYTFALADASEGKLVTASNAAAATYTVPPQSSVTWANGAVLRILNQGAGTVTIAAGAGVTINGTPLTLAQYKGAALQRTASNTWTIIPFVGGVGNAIISDTPTGSYTGYQYWTYTASSTLTVTGAGLVDVMVCGGGAGGGGEQGGGGGGGGDVIEYASLYVPVGSVTVTVGAGGAAGASGVRGSLGGVSSFGSLLAIGGGAGGASGTANDGNRPTSGASGGGGGPNALTTAGLAFSADTGSNGGLGSGAGYSGGGGGGGSTATGSNAANPLGGNGGAGTSNSYTGAAIVVGSGGGGGTNASATAATGGTNAGNGATNAANATAGTANRGGGGGGGGGASQTAAAGGSGVVIIRVAV